MPNAFVVDIGTQSMRGIVFDHHGNMLAKKQVKYKPYLSRKNGYMEQDPEMYWEVMCEICRDINKNHPDIMKDVVAMSVDTFRDTAVLLDKDKQVLRNAILWSDQRMAKLDTKLPLLQRLAFSVVGMTRSINAIRKKIKTTWIRQNQPEIWAKVDKVVHLSAFINYKLTDNLVDCYASSIGHLPFYNKKKRWFKSHELLFPIFELPLSMMIPLVAPGEVMGTITQQASELTGLPAGLEVVASGSDKGCETLGVGCVGNDVASISFGTSSTVQFSTKRYFEPEPFMPAYPSVLKDYYNPEVQIFRGYWMISWFKNNFAQHLEKKAEESGKSVEELMNEEMAAIPAGSEGLVLQPFWQAGLTTPEAKGAIIGFTDFHTRAHVYRAIVEGIDFALREGLERMERRGKMKIKYISVSGGGSQSDLICQIAANVFNKPVRRVQTYETSALGAAIVVMTAKGVYGNPEQAVKEMVHYTDTFMPQPQCVKKYDEIYKKVYLKLYSKLQRFYLKLED